MNATRKEQLKQMNTRSAANSGPEDEELLLAYRESGDQDKLGELVRRYERELYSYLRRFLGDAALAEDAFQNTFLQVHTKCDSFDGSRRFRPWLYTIATNQAIDIQRRNKRHQIASLDRPQRSAHAEVGTLMNLLESGDASASDKFDLREKMDWVRTAVAALPEQLASAIGLVYFRGMKYREAAEELAVPVGTVKSRLHSAVQQLGDAWEQSHGRRGE
ncbi:RNA polymerase sigma factor [Aeoliella sp. SH292]|uniref:RNA polymerase sigma factor n=1 Tax=Aeoliella sp. SH292 TaxID=3454464 RepID=UPI003F97F56D